MTISVRSDSEHKASLTCCHDAGIEPYAQYKSSKKRRDAQKDGEEPYQLDALHVSAPLLGLLRDCLVPAASRPTMQQIAHQLAYLLLPREQAARCALHKQIEVLQSDKSALEQQTEALQSELKQHRDELGQLKAKLQDAQKEYKDLKDSHDVLRCASWLDQPARLCDVHRSDSIAVLAGL